MVLCNLRNRFNCPKMLFQVTICLLFCQAFSSAMEQPSQSGNIRQLRSSPAEEISPVFNELAPENGPAEENGNVSYKPVTLEATSKITPKEAQCLKIGSQVKSISRASLRAPLSNSKHFDTLKVVCGSQQKPKIWFAQSKYQDLDNRQKVQSLTFEDTDTAVVILHRKLGTFNFELPGCNVCVKKNEADSNYLNVFIASSNDGEKLTDGTPVNSNFPEPFNREKKIRVKRATNSIHLSTSSAKKNVGESLTVTCSAQNNNITWKDPRGIEVKSMVNSNPRVKESFTRSHNNSELIFRSITTAAEGKYTCTVNQRGKIDAETFSLSVVAPIIKPTATITPSKKNIALEEGADYTVECSGNSNNVTWKHPLNYIIPTYGGGVGTSYLYMLPSPNLNKTTLFFKNVSASFGGEYLCSVNSSGLQDTVKLSVSISRPRLTFSPDDKDTFSVKENNDFDVSCEGPMRTIRWYYDNKEVSSNKKDDVFQKSPEMEGGVLKRKLKFDDLQPENSGKYTCVGFLTFNESRIERSFTLSVKENDVLNNPKITVDDNKVADTNLYYRVNETLEVVCKGDTEDISWKGPPNSWNIPETLIASNRINAERIKKKKVALKFKSITTSDEGTYICEVSRRKTTKSKSFKLYVIDPVRIISFPENPITREGGYVTLGCLTTGHPKALVNWYFNEIHADGRHIPKLIDGQSNSRYKLDGDNLIISNITYREAGKYMCEAKQDIERGETDRRTMDITVQHKPYPSRNRTIYEKKLNTHVQVPCKMVANPDAYYTWHQMINGSFKQISAPSPDNTLKLNFVDKSQFGEYKCVANNEIGYNEQHILLIPMENPRPPTIQLDKVTKDYAYIKAVAVRNSSFIFYNIEYKEKDTRDWIDLNVTLGENWESVYEIPKLFEKTSYIVRVRSINDLGISEPSNELEFTTASGIRLAASFVVFFAILFQRIF